MTIEEFKKNITPYMNKGWVAMDRNKRYWWYSVEPTKTNSYWCITTKDENDVCFLGKIYNIEPVKNWSKSLIEVGQ